MNGRAITMEARVEPFWPGVCSRNSLTAGKKAACLLKLAVASRRSVVKVNREIHYLWRAVDHECEVLESEVRKD